MKPEAAKENSSSQSNLVNAPSISLPKGGGAIKGIGEKFSANPVTGTGSMSVPIALSPGRGGFGPQLSLNYDSGAGQGVFGLGWQIASPSISRKTDKGLPRYLDEENSDVFLISGAEDLVPVLENSSARKEEIRLWGKNYVVSVFRPRIEGLFAHIEYWVEIANKNNAFWRSISRDNITSWYGLDADSRIFDPDNHAHIFQWLLCKTHDDKGNLCEYKYIENEKNGSRNAKLWEANRLESSRTSNRYLKRILYGNRSAYHPILDENIPENTNTEWMFEAVFDYGDHDLTNPQPIATINTPSPDWVERIDAFSQHRAGFEIRTDRLCRRVLMFHHFPEDEDTQLNCLVKSTDFHYERADLNDLIQSGYSVLQSVTHHAYQKRVIGEPAYESRQFPPVTFSYSQPNINKTLQHINAAQLENLPVGIQGPGYRWLDLDGEGLSGVLAETTGGWHYKPNLGDGNFGALRSVAPIPVAALADGGHQFMDLSGNGEIDVVDFAGATPGFYERDSERGWKQHIPFLNLPNINWQDPNLRFLDLTGDGHADALITEQDVFTWYPSLDDRGFDNAEQTRQAIDEDAGPRLVFADVVQTIFLADMCGDGLTDLVRIRNGEVCYWPNLGYGKFGRKVTLGNSPRFDVLDLFDPSRIRLADIDGSGPVDIIYLGRQGAQLYFNRSGNVLSQPIIVDLPLATQNLNSVQVADLFGNGTACLVWSSHLPADATRPVCYIDLMGGTSVAEADKIKQRTHEKPHLLIKIDNNMGAITEIEYTPSTRFYLQDKLAGFPWITRLPFPVYCVSKTTAKDHWRGTEFSSTYSYHHGYFDGAEREFRGFGRVEQVDAELFSRFAENNIGSPWITQDKKLYQPPIKTITWYHTGAAIDRQKILTQFEQEYFTHKFRDRFVQTTSLFHENALPEPELSNELTASEWREALRACKGMVLRQESYELDLDDLTVAQPKHTPVRLYSAANHNCNIQCLQQRGSNRHAVFLVTESEALTYHYELAIPKTGRLIPDPRISHTINLRHDKYGNPQQSIAIGYKRWKRSSSNQLIDNVQAEEHVVYNETHYTNDVLLPEPTEVVKPELKLALKHYRLCLPYEVQTYELTHIHKANPFYYSPQDFRKLKLSDIYDLDKSDGVEFVPYHQHATKSTPQKRIIEHVCTRFFDDAAETPEDSLAFGKLGPRGFKYEDYKLALTTDLLSAVFAIKDSQNQIVEDKLAWSVDANETVREKMNKPLGTNNTHHLKSGYIRGEAINTKFTGQYWMRSGIAGFAPSAPNNFYLPNLYTDPFGNPTTLSYDPLNLFITQSKDAKGNVSGIYTVNNKPRFNYRVLAPIEMVDANGNHSEVAFDIFGLVVAAATKGKLINNKWQGDNLDGFDFALINPHENEVYDFCFKKVFDQQQENKAREWLANASARFIYHFGELRDLNNKPTWRVRMSGACGIAREIHAGQAGGATSPLQISLECSDGSGAVVMKKVQAELDPVPTSPTLPTDSTRRWIINGLTLLNNKGKPVKQYEPVFSNDFGCEMPQANGISSTIFYDAAGRVVRTEFPDGTLSRVVFSPWFSRSYDQNDTVLESKWYKARNALARSKALPANPDPQQRAGWLAAQHANTPADTHFDSLGREVISIAQNRTNGVYEKYITFTKLDAEGKPLWIRDARGNLVMQYVTPYKANNDPSNALPYRVDASTGKRIYSAPCYDMAGNLLFQHSMDAGDRWTINDAAGKPMFAWDVYQSNESAAEQKRLYSTEYDELHRPIALKLKIDIDAFKVIEKFVYQDAIDQPINNLNGQATHHYDASGLNEVIGVDFAGSPLEIRRTLVLDKTAAFIDWQGNLSSKLETETWIQITEYDALKRMTKLFNWHRDVKFDNQHNEQVTPGVTNRVAIYIPRYNERGLLSGETLHVRASKIIVNGVMKSEIGQARTQQAIVDIGYDAKGQRQYLKLGNGTVTRYTYDPESFRLVQLYTKRSASDSDSPLPAGVQNLSYVYDPSGNIVHIRDDAQQTVFFQNAAIEPHCSYVYDALYRLIEAKGREQAQSNQAPATPEGDWPKISVPTDRTLREYTQRYVYDSVGNFIAMHHQAGSGSWQRYYRTATDSNRLLQTRLQDDNWSLPDPAKDTHYRYDSHGSMLNIGAQNTDFDLHWDHRDMISHLWLGGGGDAYYQYDSNKQRTRKYIQRNNSIEEERIYLGAFERYRRKTASGVVEEIESHHLFAGDQRVLLVDDVIQARSQPGFNNISIEEGTYWRYQYSNHLGSSTLELDEQTRVISYEEYHPYGTAAFRMLNSNIRAPAKRYRYTGMERDEESGLSYHGARYYSSSLASWISVDPAGVGAGLQLYWYCLGNPIGCCDRNGCQPEFLEKLALYPIADAWQKKDASSRPPGFIGEEIAQHWSEVGDKIGNFLIDHSPTPNNSDPGGQVALTATTVATMVAIVGGIKATLDDPGFLIRGVMRFGLGSAQGVQDIDAGNKVLGVSKIVGEVAQGLAMALGAVQGARFAGVTKGPAVPPVKQQPAKTGTSSISSARKIEPQVGTVPSPELAQLYEEMAAQGVKFRGNFVNVDPSHPLIGLVRSMGGAMVELDAASLARYGVSAGDILVNLQEIKARLAAGALHPLTSIQQVLLHEMGHVGQPARLIGPRVPADPYYAAREAAASMHASTLTPIASDSTALLQHAQEQLNAAISYIGLAP